MSSLAEVEEQLSPATGEWQPDRGLYLFKYTRRLDLSHVEVCVHEDKLIALNLFGLRHGRLPQLLSEWIARLGDPDLVTFADSYDARSIIWAEEGTLVVVEVYYEDDMTKEGTVRNVILFSPIAPENLPTSWLVSQLPSEPGLPPDAFFLIPTESP